MGLARALHTSNFFTGVVPEGARRTEGVHGGFPAAHGLVGARSTETAGAAPTFITARPGRRPAATGRLLDIMAILRHTGGAALSADDIARRLPEPALGFELYPALVRLEAEGLVARFEVSRSRLGSRRS